MKPGFFLLVLGLFQVTHAEPAVSPVPDRLIPFKCVEGETLQLHVFEPEGRVVSEPRPAIVFFFGGGWSGGSPKQFYEQSRYLADLGVVAFSAEYRVKSRNQTTPFESVQDAKSAIRWVRAHAAELGVDPERIVAAGGSAGGHLAACTGVIQGQEGEGEDLSVSSLPTAMVLFNPVLDTTARGFGLKQVGTHRQTEISPCHHVRKGIAPTLLFHGTADTTVPFENAERFTRLMEEAGNRCELKAFKGRKHGFFNGPFFRPKLNDTSDFTTTMAESVSFLSSLGFLNMNESQ